jgi:peptidoglycan hydrolase-like protein with peptidoglycan-binding domain
MFVIPMRAGERPVDSSGAGQVLSGLSPGAAVGGPSRRRRWLFAGAALCVLVACGVTLVVVRGGFGAAARSPHATASAGLTTVPVVRTTVRQRDQVDGTLGYAGSWSVINQLRGTLTAVPAVGAVLHTGQAGYEVDGVPIVLLAGMRPAWRSFTLGMSDGPDVTELERNLRGLGFDPSHAMTVDRHFTANTSIAIERFQAAYHLPVTGTLELGRVAFVPYAAFRVTAVQAAPGAAAGPGTPLLDGTSTEHVVTVALDPSMQRQVRVGDTVTVTVANTAVQTAGVVSAVSGVAAPSGQSSNGPAAPTVAVTVRLRDPAAAGDVDQAPVQVAITDQQHANVLAVPVTALLARPGGGYAITVANGGTTRDLPVVVGLFDDTTQLAEVSGTGLAAGQNVVVPVG